MTKEEAIKFFCSLQPTSFFSHTSNYDAYSFVKVKDFDPFDSQNKVEEFIEKFKKAQEVLSE